jgi:N-acyl-D-aspartate/D-glutamate deacylase
LILRGARVIDGTGSSGTTGDVTIVDGRIAAVGEADTSGSVEIVDLDGLTLAPGFIDVHTHFDAQVFWDPDFTPSSWHGVTTAVAGNCGFGLAPTRPADRQAIMETLEKVEGMNLKTLTSGIDWSFESFPDYLALLARLPKRINLGAYVGHTPVRTYVMGTYDAPRRAATAEEIARMGEIVSEAMSCGAVGFSTSFAPTHVGAKALPVPSRLAGAGEVRALASVVANAGRGVVQITYGPQMTIEDAARLSEDLGVRVTWGALLTGLFGPPGTAVQMLDAARALADDIWPQVSCREIVFQMTMLDPYFFGTVPAFQEVLRLPRADRARVYADASWRDRARPQIEQHRPGAYWRCSIEETELHRAVRGRSMEDLSAERGVDPFDLWLDLALAEDLHTRFRIVSRNEDPDELGALIRDKRVVLGAHDAGAHVDMLCDANFATHLLGHWVRDLQVLPLEDAVWRLTGQPAELFGLTGRGRIEPGFAADLVAFDPQTVAALPLERRWDFPAGGERLVSESNGIEHVWVNGQPIRRDGKDVPGAHPGTMVP